MAVLRAAAGLLAEVGYDHLTIEAIARRAGVGKPTVYRWWKSKAAVISECLLEGLILPGRLAMPRSGDLRTDLTTWLRAIFHYLEGPDGNAFRSLIAVAAENPEVSERLSGTFAGGSMIEARLRQGVDDGDLYENAPTAQIAELTVAAAILRAINRVPTSDVSIVRLVDALLQGNEPAP